VASAFYLVKEIYGSCLMDARAIELLTLSSYSRSSAPTPSLSSWRPYNSKREKNY
jgi:hypothetical protein